MIEHYNFSFHLLAFLSSGLHTIISVLNINLQGDSISGLCTIDLDQQFNYLMLPEIVVLTFNLLVYAITILYSFKIKRFLDQENLDSNSFDNLALKLVVFFTIYSIAYVAQFQVFLFESYKFNLWAQQWYKTTICDQEKDNCLNKTEPTFVFAIFKYLIYFLPCLASCTVFFCTKTIRIWPNF